MNDILRRAPRAEGLRRACSSNVLGRQALPAGRARALLRHLLLNMMHKKCSASWPVRGRARGVRVHHGKPGRVQLPGAGLSSHDARFLAVWLSGCLVCNYVHEASGPPYRSTKCGNQGQSLITNFPIEYLLEIPGDVPSALTPSVALCVLVDATQLCLRLGRLALFPCRRRPRPHTPTLFPLSRECMRPKLYMSTVESPSFPFFFCRNILGLVSCRLIMAANVTWPSVSRNMYGYNLDAV